MEMEMSSENEQRLTSYRPSDEAMNELRSPPRIRRLQDRQRSYGVSRSDSYISSSDEESSVDSSIDLPCCQTLDSSSELRSPSWELHQLSSTTPPPLSSSGTNNCDITEYRRRLEIIKERRVRHISRSSEHTSQLLSQEHGIESNLINRPTAYGHQRKPSATVDEVFELLQEVPLPIEKTKPFSAIKDSITASTCQTFDEITIDTTRSMDSTTNICQNSSSGHRLPISPPSISSGQGRKGNVFNNNNALKIRRLMCTPSQKKIDTSFEQIRGTICNTSSTLTPSTANDDVDKHYSEMTKGNGTSDDSEHIMGDGEFPGIAASSTINFFNAPDNESLDRMLCTEPLSPNGKQLESSLPETKRRSSSFSFQAHTKHDNKDEDNANLQDETPNISSMNHAMGSPGRSRRFFRPRARGRAYIVMDSDDQSSQQQHQQITTEADSSITICRRKTSSFSWLRKDPWYLRPANTNEGGGDEIMADDYGHTNNEVLDRMMHAVVYVTEK
jgi:hypothetical protein